MSLPSNSFLSAGHVPTLFASFLYFDISFMVWVLLGSLGVQIAKLLALDPTQKGVMVAVPVLSDALLRIPFGLAADHFGARITAIVTKVIAAIPSASQRPRNGAAILIDAVSSNAEAAAAKPAKP